MNLENKVAIVTGGAKGLGKSYCSLLLQKGVKVSIVDKDESSGNKQLNQFSQDYGKNVMFVHCDVSIFDELKGAFEKTIATFGHIDIIVNNAGVLDEHDWKKMLDINLVGVIHGIKLAFQYMSKNGNKSSGGCVINTGSNAAFSLFPLSPVYAACKHAIVGLTKNYGSNYYFEKTGVAVNALCPGPIDTDLFHTFPQMSVDKEMAEIHNSKIKPASPDVVAKALLQLLHDQRNGALLRVHLDGSTEYC